MDGRRRYDRNEMERGSAKKNQARHKRRWRRVVAIVNGFRGAAAAGRRRFAKSSGAFFCASRWGFCGRRRRDLSRSTAIAAAGESSASVAAARPRYARQGARATLERAGNHARRPPRAARAATVGGHPRGRAADMMASMDGGGSKSKPIPSENDALPTSFLSSWWFACNRKSSAFSTIE